MMSAVRLPARLRRRAGPPPAGRSLRFRHEPHDRFWWHKLAATDYVPPLYAALRDDEWKVMEDWYAETGARARLQGRQRPGHRAAPGLAPAGRGPA